MIGKFLFSWITEKNEKVQRYHDCLRAGWQYRANGGSRQHNPYVTNTVEHNSWDWGWMSRDSRKGA
jgi:tRNA splicing endonuclease